jgi:hypothetical protein
MTNEMQIHMTYYKKNLLKKTSHLRHEIVKIEEKNVQGRKILKAKHKQHLRTWQEEDKQRQ